MKIISKFVCCILAILLVGEADAGGKCQTKSNYNAVVKDVFVMEQLVLVCT